MSSCFRSYGVYHQSPTLRDLVANVVGCLPQCQRDDRGDWGTVFGYRFQDQCCWSQSINNDEIDEISSILGYPSDISTYTLGYSIIKLDLFSHSHADFLPAATWTSSTWNMMAWLWTLPNMAGFFKELPPMPRPKVCQQEVSYLSDGACNTFETTNRRIFLLLKTTYTGGKMLFLHKPTSVLLCQKYAKIPCLNWSNDTDSSFSWISPPVLPEKRAPSLNKKHTFDGKSW